ncbi:MAG: hypothetical protein C0514_08000 [Candidatus Puniceispirillum sp.]|nr:hypothetical protein [Candidatus Puniceispirillum sp.]
MFKNIFLTCLLSIALACSGQTSTLLDLEEVMRDYRAHLPRPAHKEVSQEMTALNAAKFVLGFLGDQEKEELSSSLRTIDPFHDFGSLQSTMIFHNYYQTEQGEIHIKSDRDKRVGQLYRTLLESLQRQTPVVGYLYGSAFKSAYLFDAHTKKGKVLSRGVDLQERLEYESYAHLQRNLRNVGISFHFVVIRDAFHAYALDLSGENEKIQPCTPEIASYGQAIAGVAKEAGIVVMELSDLKDLYGRSFESCVRDRTATVLRRAETENTTDVKGLSGFFEKEYEHEAFSRKEKSVRALKRAKRYLALKNCVKEQEEGFIFNTFSVHFGQNASLISFSIHVEDYLKSCIKLPLRPLPRFKGGCNAQHQIPLLQRTSSGNFFFYSVRADIMRKIMGLITVTSRNVSGHKTLYYEGDLDLESTK